MGALGTNRRLPIVGVMGSGTNEHAGLAEPLGEALAEMGVHLLTGGGAGVMAAASRAFTSVAERAGLSLGVLPGVAGGERGAGGCDASPPGYPNRWVELEVRTHLGARGGSGEAWDSRNHVNVLSSHVVVALPGGSGTASEVALAIRYGRPLVLYGRDDPPGSLPRGAADAPPVASTLEDVLAFVRRRLPDERGGPAEDVRSPGDSGPVPPLRGAS